MSESAEEIQRRIAELQAQLQALQPSAVPASDAVAGDKLGGDKVIGDKVIEPQGIINVDSQGRINGIAVGVNLGRIVYGRDVEEVERKRLAWYLDNLANKLYRLPLRGIEQRLDHGEGVAMPHVYVMLALVTPQTMAKGENFASIKHFFENLDERRRTAQPSDAIFQLLQHYDPDWALPDKAIVARDIGGIISITEGREPLSIGRYHVWRALLATEAVYQHPHLVLIGDPGSGKSTFMRHLAWALAQRGLDQNSQAPQLFGWPDNARRLPLFLPLRSLAGAIAVQGDQPATLAAVLSAELASTYNVREAEVLVDQALHSGAALLLLDGLDEVSLENARGHADRATVLRVVREFARLYPTARIVLTCRTRAFDDKMRAKLGWHVETIAPFTLGQIRHFVPAWYGELVASGQIEQTEATLTSKKLLAAITDPARLRLREMAATPLLLTMMAIVLYSQGELPRDRPQLYERILELLLGQWDKVRDGKSLAEAIGKPEWESRDFLPLLDRLCYEAHRDTTSEDGRGRLSRGALYTALIDFFKQAQMPQPWYAAQCCLDYFEQRSGLLAADENDNYVFAHLTLQEHGAGRHMAVQSDDPTGMLLERRGEDRWREPLMLGAGLPRPAELNTFLTDLVDRDGRKDAKPLDRWYLDLILAAEIGADRDWNLLRTRPAIKVDRLQRDLRRGLAELLGDKTQLLPAVERVRAGFLLGDLGDPRLPVTLDDWRIAISALSSDSSLITQNSLLEDYFCRVEAGTYTIGSADGDLDADKNEKPQHTVAFDAPLWIARYPITNAQWQAWVEQAGGQHSYFADDTDLNRPNQPVVGVTWYSCNDFCAWLSEQLDVTVRLSTEQEWEAAARGGDARRYPWGHDWQDDCAATEEDRETRGWRWSIPVGCYPAGAAPCGALDMAGNVREWTASEWQSYPDADKPFTDQDRRTLRGGSAGDSRTFVRCGARGWFGPGNSGNIVGFRVVLAPRSQK
jgi:formylglycine-generating enzyme required for sulfatase activity